jgi:hypothetical protein
MLGHLPRGDGGPQHGRQLRFQRGQIPTHTTLDKMRNSREIRLVEKGVDEFPISGIPTDGEMRFKVFGYRGTAWRRRRAHAVAPKASSASNAPDGSGTAAASISALPALMDMAVLSSR